jgi:hypothetical protein
MKRLNGKRTLTEVTYEFHDGTEQKLTVQSLSTSEFESVGNGETSGTAANKKSIELLLVKNDPAVVEKILKEQFEEGSYADFATALFYAINEEKKGKLNG